MNILSEIFRDVVMMTGIRHENKDLTSSGDHVC